MERSEPRATLVALASPSAGSSAGDAAVGDAARRARAVPGGLPAPPFATELLKEDVVSRVERLSQGDRSWIRKTYSPAPFFLWRTFLVRSKAAREHRNLKALVDAGVPAVVPLGWDERRRAGCVPECSLWLEDAGRAGDLRGGFATDDVARRRALAAGMGGLLRTLHAAGFVSLTAYPRNVLVPERAERGLLFCDQPYLKRRPAPVQGFGAGIDLYDALFTAGRQRMLSRSERWRALLAYCGGDRVAARSWWRRLVRRPRWQQRFYKGCIKVGGNIGVWAKQP